MESPGYHKPAKLGMVNMASIKMVILGMVYGIGFYLMNGKCSMEILEFKQHSWGYYAGMMGIAPKTWYLGLTETWGSPIWWIIYYHILSYVTVKFMTILGYTRYTILHRCISPNWELWIAMRSCVMCWRNIHQWLGKIGIILRNWHTDEKGIKQ